MLLTLIVILIILSAFFSGSEAALLKLRPSKVASECQKHLLARMTYQLLKKMNKVLPMILFGNTFANILVGSLLTTYLYTHDITGNLLIIAPFLLSLIILIFAEILPKTLATLYADKIAYSTSPLLTILYQITFPITYTLSSLNELLLRLLRLSSKTKQEFITKEEYKEMIMHGATSQKEFHHSLMMGILELNDIDVHHIMTNRKHIDLINLQHSIEAIKESIINATHENLVVIDGNLETIIGTLHTKAAWHLMLKGNFNLISLKNTLESPYFIPEKVSIPKQWQQFQSQEKRVAIVINEFGETQGVLTKNDIVQEIFVNSQSQDHKNLTLGIARIAKKTWVISGQASCHHLKKLYQWPIPAHDADTIGGSIISYLETMPTPGTCLKIGTLIYEVLSVDLHKILKIKVTITS